MPNVRLIHPITVKIRKADKAFTAVMDDDLHEPVGQVRRPLKPVTLQAQFKIGNTKEAIFDEGGVIQSSDGYCLFRTEDLRAIYFNVERGDRIIEMGSGRNVRHVDLYIIHLMWMGHYQDHLGPSLLRAYFADRQPSRQREL